MKTTSDDNRTVAPCLLGDGQQLLTPEERTLLQCCHKARDLEQVGDYESACLALSKWWPLTSKRPRTDGLALLAAAELLLRAGALISRLVSSKQTQGSEVNAKELISESISLFEQAEQEVKAAEARAELGWCYWREGDFEGARSLLQQALKAMGHGTDGFMARAVALIYAAVVELDSGHPAIALELLKETAPLIDSCDSQALKGSLHNNLGLVYKELGQRTDQEDFFDQAMIAFTAACYHFSQAKAKRLFAKSENNLGFVFFLLGKFDKAAGRLRRAHKCFVEFADAGTAAQVKDTQARLHLAQGHCEEAKRVAAEAVRVLEAGERPAVLAEALTTWGVALARSGCFDESRETLERAVKVAEEARAWETAGLAALSAFEELSERLSFVEARKLYERARFLLVRTRHFDTPRRRLDKAGGRIIAATRMWESYPVSPADRVDGSAALEATLLPAATQRLSDSHSPMLVTGKSAKARRLRASFAHEQSGRLGPFVVVDCAALEKSDALREFLGRDTRRAAHGTLFFDKVHELSHNNQQRLLMLVKDGVIEYGRDMPRRERIDLWVIMGTSCDLSAKVADGEFLPALYNRLSGVSQMSAPSVEALEEMYMQSGCIYKDAVERCQPKGAAQPDIDLILRMPAAEVPGALARLLTRQSASAPSNNGHIHAGGGAMVTASALVAQVTADNEERVTFDECLRRVERLILRDALEAAEGQPTVAARLLGMKRQTLVHKLEKYPELLKSRTPIVKRRRRHVAAGAHDEELAYEMLSGPKK